METHADTVNHGELPEAEWLALRSRLVTGSQLAAILGESKWETREELMERKLSGAGIEETAPMWWGKASRATYTPCRP